MSEPRDPLRIPGILGALQRAWEAQPNVTFPQLWAQIEAYGVGFNSTDGELEHAAAALLADHPRSFAEFLAYPPRGSNPRGDAPSDATTDRATPPDPLVASDSAAAPGRMAAPESAAASGSPAALGSAAASGRAAASGSTVAQKHRNRSVLVECYLNDGSEQLVTLSTPDDDRSGWVLVRRGQLQPVVWRYSKVVTCSAGGPVIVEDAEGVRHRLGLAIRLTALGFAMDSAALSEDLAQARRSSIEDRVFIVTCDDGSTVQIDHGVRIFSPGRRDIGRLSMKWSRVAHCQPGQPLVLVDAGGAAVEFPAVVAVFRAE